MAADKTKRTFIAIKVPKVYEILAILDQAKNQIQKAKINWVDIANMHLTLKFLGETPVSKINSITETLKTIIGKHHSTHLKLDSIGTFGGSHHPKIIFLGGSENNEIISLQKNIEEALVPLGFEKEERRFAIHLTLGRIKEVYETDSIHHFIKTVSINHIPLITVDNIIFYESILHPKGPEYKPIAVFPLQKTNF